MKTAGTFRLVFVTAPDLRVARRLAKAVLTARLAACVNLVPRLESHYWWLGRIESAAEVLLIVKTTAARVPALERLIVAQHPYETPEFLVLPIQAGSRRYLAWVADSVK